MGREVCRAVAAATDLDLVATVDPADAGAAVATLAGCESDVVVAPDLDTLVSREVDVAVDFTHPDAVARNVVWCLEHRIHVVVGTTGWGDRDLASFSEAAAAGAVNVLVAPNFAIGAVLMMHFATIAARHLPHAEIVELHHERKADAPSGTALRTADLIAAARDEAQAREGDGGTPIGESVAGARGADRAGVRVHSVRLPGLVAHQEVIFGGDGQTLSLRHDSIDRASFMPGVLLAVRRVGELPGLTVGLEQVLGL